MTILEAIADLVDAQTSLTLGSNLFIGRFPDDPDLAACVYEYEGAVPVETFRDGGWSLDMPRLQVVTRASREDYPTARDLAITIRSVVGAVVDQTLSGVTVLRVQALGSPMPLGLDAHNRPRFSVNYQATVD